MIDVSFYRHGTPTGCSSFRTWGNLQATPAQETNSLCYKDVHAFLERAMNRTTTNQTTCCYATKMFTHFWNVR